jgi:glutaminyl-peptide cyclotransferase
VNVRLLLAALAAALTATASSGSQRPATTETPTRLRVEVLRTYPHDREAFTQGLVLDGGRLYESTGLVGRSSLREVELETGRVIRKVDVPAPIFAEGLALAADRLIQLTWQDGRAIVYDRQKLTRQSEFTYRGEGWGLCYDGRELAMTDGSSTLSFRSPRDFSVVRTVRVTMTGRPLDRLNEIECVGGAVYANVWTEDVIVRIDAATGVVSERIDAPGLLSPIERHADAVLNGIAYDPSDQTFLITGKLWPKLFRVRFVR